MGCGTYGMGSRPHGDAKSVDAESLALLGVLFARDLHMNSACFWSSLATYDT